MTKEQALLAWTESNKARLMTHLNNLKRQWDTQRGALDETESEMDGVRLQMQVYDQFLNQASVILSGAEDEEHDERPRPTAAVDELVAAEPGIMRSEILERLDGRVRSKSLEPKRVLSAAVSRGKADRSYFVTRAGRVYMYDHPDAVNAREASGFMKQGAALRE